MNPILSIIIVNYNGVKFISECLLSVATYAQCPYEIIIVDNASIDGSCAFIRENFPHVRLIENRTNLGFAAGNNAGAEYAHGELLLLLNNDTRLLTSLISAVKRFETDRQLGVLGCRMSYGDGRLQSSIGIEATPLSLVLSWLGLGRFAWAPDMFKRLEIDKNYYAEFHMNVAWVSGAFFMTRRDLWNKLSGLDERYFMYMEDLDYCKRARAEGYHVGYTPEVDIIHYEGAGKAWLGAEALKNTMYSYFVYLRKYYKRGSVIVVWMGLNIVMTARALAFYSLYRATGSVMASEKARAYKDLLPYLLKCMKEEDE
jgi:GT2 family glycosyltransferase